MPIRIGDLTEFVNEYERETKFDFLGNEITISYRPRAITPALLAKIRRMPVESLGEQVAQVVTKWDVLDDDGIPMEVAESASDMPIPFLQAVINAVIVDMSPGDDAKKA